ncbi:MAG: M48 family metallopeptidase [Acidimicrobiia bacterium]
MRRRLTPSPVLPGFEPPVAPGEPVAPVPTVDAAPPDATTDTTAPPAPTPATVSTVEVLAQDLGDGVDFRVEVTRSARRKRSVGANLVGDVLRITIPSWMSWAEESRWVDTMSARYRRKLSSDRIDLVERATTLARRFDLPRPREIRWADDMTARWGSCTPGTATIRISNRLARFPDWVIDYVIVHELAHLELADHSADFWRLVHRYPRAERATGYLIAKSGDVETD